MKTFNRLKYVLAISLFLFYPAYAADDVEPQELIAPNENDTQSSLITKVEIENVEIRAADFIPAPNWEEIKPDILKRQTIKYIQAKQRMQELLLQAPKKELLELARLNEAEKEKKGFLWSDNESKIELNALEDKDGVFFIRILDKLSGIPLFCFDSSEFIKDSKYLARIIAESHINAGEKDQRGRKIGRHVALIVFNNEEVSETSFLPRPKPGTWEWWRDYFRSVIDMPEKGQILWTLTTMAPLQATIVGLISGIKNYPSMDYKPVILTGVFATVFGVFKTSYGKLLARSSAPSRIFKQSTLSGFSYAYSLMFIKMGLDHHAALKIFNISDPQSLLIHGEVFLNSFLHRFISDAWGGISRIREELRHSAGKFSFKVFGYEFSFSKTSIEQDILYLGQLFLRVSGLYGLGKAFTVPFVDVPIDTGILIQLASVPIVQYLALLYARKHNYSGVSELEEQWKLTKRFPYLFPKIIFDWIRLTYSDLRHHYYPLLKETVKSVFSNLGIKNCLSLLTKRKKIE